MMVTFFESTEGKRELPNGRSMKGLTTYLAG